MPSNLRKLTFGAIAICLGILVPLFIFEIALRFFPVNEGLRAQIVNDENPIFHFKANRTSIFSEHWNFDIVNLVRTNNYGFINDLDYNPKADTPLLMVIGDSYIEAAMVPYEQTVHGRLARIVGDRGRVYSLAASGAALSQYLVWSEFAQKEFHLDGLLVSIVSNDFLESLQDQGRSPGFYRFERLPDDGFRLVREDYAPNLIRQFFRHSSLAMYLMTNLKVYEHIKLFFDNLQQSELPSQVFFDSERSETPKLPYVANVPVEVSGKDLGNSQWATEVFLDQLVSKSGLPSSRIILIVDGFRPQMYDLKDLLTVRKSYWSNIRQYFITKALEKGYEVIDLHHVFMDWYSRHNKHFEFPTDAHWNEEGHAAVADVVKSSHVFQEVFDDVQ